MHCAPQLTLASISWIVIGVVFAIGVLLLGISSAMLRSVRESAPLPAAPLRPWPQLIDESLTSPDVPLRLDMIERLEIIANPWSRSILEQAWNTDPDESVRNAASRALQQ